jgi:hypothetical protein
VKKVKNQIPWKTDLLVSPSIVMDVKSRLEPTGHIAWMGDGWHTLRVLGRYLLGSSNLD